MNDFLKSVKSKYVAFEEDKCFTRQEYIECVDEIIRRIKDYILTTEVKVIVLFNSSELE